MSRIHAENARRNAPLGAKTSTSSLRGAGTPRAGRKFLPRMSRMDTDESPVGAAPKETPGGSPRNAHETEKPCKGDPVPAANGRARRKVAPTGLVGFSALPQVSTWGFKEGRLRRGLFKARKDFQTPRRGEIAQRRASELVRAALRKPYRKNALCRSAIERTHGRREKSPADFADSRGKRSKKRTLGGEDVHVFVAGRGNAARRMFASGHPIAAGTKAGMPSSPNAPSGRNKSNPMRAAKRALGERSAYRARLKGATARSVRRSRRGSCAFQARVLFVCPSPKQLPPHGVILVPHFMRIPRGNAWGRKRPRLRCGARGRRARDVRFPDTRSPRERRQECLRPQGPPRKITLSRRA